MSSIRIPSTVPLPWKHLFAGAYPWLPGAWLCTGPEVRRHHPVMWHLEQKLPGQVSGQSVISSFSL